MGLLTRDKPHAAAIGDGEWYLAKEIVREAFDLKVERSELDDAEQAELASLARQIRVTEITKLEVQVAPREKVEKYATDALAVAAKAETPLGKRAGELLSARSRQINNYPSPDDQARIFSNQDPAATLDSLHLAPPRTSETTTTHDLGQLKPDKRERLKDLVEKGAGFAPGEYFEARLKEQKTRTDYAMLRGLKTIWPRRRRRLDEPGVGWLPPGMLDDVLMTSPNGVRLTFGALGVWGFVNLMLEGQRVSPAAAREGTRIEDGKLVFPSDQPPFRLADPEGEIRRVKKYLEDLLFCGWLTVDCIGAYGKVGGEVSIGYGPETTKFLAKREEVAT
jgi:hypothetical protein